MIPSVSEIYLFGSLINEDGIDFNSINSDFDFVLVMKENTTLTERLTLIHALEPKVDELEGRIIKGLKREAGQAHTSFVCLTPFEAEMSVHKSRNANLLSMPQFLRLGADAQYGPGTIRLSEGVEGDFATRNSDPLEVLYYSQNVRNKFLNNSYNTADIKLRDYAGEDPLPKDLMRTAAHLGWSTLNRGEASRIDLKTGSTYISRILENDDTEHAKTLAKKIESRSLGRGASQGISRDEILYLSELLFDHAIKKVSSRKVALDKVIEGI